MRDLFFTILAIWLVYRIWTSFSVIKKTNQSQSPFADQRKKEGETTVDYIPPKNKKDNDDGEYVDYEEVK